MQKRPPLMALFVLRSFLSRASYEAIAGDLCEEFQMENVSRSWFWRQVISTLRLRWKPTPDWIDIRPHPSPDLFVSIGRDLRYALRMLRRTPAFTVVAVGAVALGIGVNTGIVTLLDALVLRPVPVRKASEVIALYQSIEGLSSRNVDGSPSYFSYPEYRQYADAAQSLAGLIAYFPGVRSTLTGRVSAQLQGQLVTCNYFGVLGREPFVGRGFSPGDCRSSGSASVAVISEAAWRARFHSDRSIVGQTIFLSRQPFTVIGIAPAGFQGTFLASNEFWAPLEAQPLLEPQRNMLVDPNFSWLCLLGRLKPEVSTSEARAELQRIASRIDKSQAGRRTKLHVATATLFSEPERRQSLLYASTAVFIGVSLILLIACANVANLLLARATRRKHEISIRLSVGASRGLLIRQLLIESVLISITGGLLGTLLAHIVFREFYGWILRIMPANAPLISLNLSLDWRILVYMLAISMLTGFVFGLLPALEATKVDLNPAMKEDLQVPKARAGKTIRGFLLGSQIAVCFILLVAAGLLGRGLISAQSMDPGFDTKGIVATRFELSRDGYSSAAATAFYNRLLDRLRANAQVQAVSFTSLIPLSGVRQEGTMVTKGWPEGVQVWTNDVAPEFFHLLNIPIERGRGFDAFKNNDAANVTIASETTARRLWPGIDPLGKQIIYGNRSYEIVGLVKDTYSTNLLERKDYFFYFPLRQGQADKSILVRGEDSRVLITILAKEIHALDPKLYCEIHTLDENRQKWSMPGKILTLLASFLGFFAVLLAASGVYGVVNYDVNRRVREIRIRMTLGAKPGDVLRMIVFQCLRPVLLGWVIGLLAAAALTKVMVSLLFGVSPLDPVTFGGMALFLFLVAAIASFAPARRAINLDPADALRHE